MAGAAVVAAAGATATSAESFSFVRSLFRESFLCTRPGRLGFNVGTAAPGCPPSNARNGFDSLGFHWPGFKLAHIQKAVADPAIEAFSPPHVDCIHPCAPVAQLDRAVASGATGREFESLRAHQILPDQPRQQNHREQGFLCACFRRNTHGVSLYIPHSLDAGAADLRRRTLLLGMSSNAGNFAVGNGQACPSGNAVHDVFSAIPIQGV